MKLITILTIVTMYSNTGYTSSSSQEINSYSKAQLLPSTQGTTIKNSTPNKLKISAAFSNGLAQRIGGLKPSGKNSLSKSVNTNYSNPISNGVNTPVQIQHDTSTSPNENINNKPVTNKKKKKPSRKAFGVSTEINQSNNTNTTPQPQNVKIPASVQNNTSIINNSIPIQNTNNNINTSVIKQNNSPSINTSVQVSNNNLDLTNNIPVQNMASQITSTQALINNNTKSTSTNGKKQLYKSVIVPNNSYNNTMLGTNTIKNNNLGIQNTNQQIPMKSNTFLRRTKRIREIDPNTNALLMKLFNINNQILNEYNEQFLPKLQENIAKIQKTLMYCNKTNIKLSAVILQILLDEYIKFSEITNTIISNLTAYNKYYSENGIQNSLTQKYLIQLYQAVNHVLNSITETNVNVFLSNEIYIKTLGIQEKWSRLFKESLLEYNRNLVQQKRNFIMMCCKDNLLPILYKLVNNKHLVNQKQKLITQTNIELDYIIKKFDEILIRIADYSNNDKTLQMKLLTQKEELVKLSAKILNALYNNKLNISKIKNSVKKYAQLITNISKTLSKYKAPKYKINNNNAILVNNYTVNVIQNNSKAISLALKNITNIITQLYKFK